MLRVYSWMELPVNVIRLLRQLMRYWKTRFEIWNEGEKKVSQRIDIMCGFLQGDRYSPPIEWVNQEKGMSNGHIARL